MPISEMLKQIDNIDHIVQEKMHEAELSACQRGARKDLNKINLLRASLFDPNVPSYLMDERFVLLDWNAAFDLVFPTDRFYRMMSVRAFVQCLAGKEGAERRGAELMCIEDDTQIKVDLEPLAYESPVYGKMRFTKIGSTVLDEKTHKTAGWIVALNVNEAEHFGAYETNLQRVNEYQSWVSSNAALWNRLLPNFAGYEAIVSKHLEGLSECRKVLDLGAGLGVLAKRLREKGTQVTSVEANDALIAIAKIRCGEDHVIVKSQIDRVHRPKKGVSVEAVGINCPYDGVSIHNSYHWIGDPVNFLTKIREDEVLSEGGLISISLSTGKQENIDLWNAIQDSVDNAEDRNAFGRSLIKFMDKGLGNWWTEADVATHLINAGYEILRKERIPYAVNGADYQGFPYFLARAQASKKVGADSDL